MNILIVEDDTAIREGVAEFLKENEYEVFCAGDGEKALEILKSKEIHLALLDIMLPKKNGIEVLKELRTFSELPVIMLTAVTDEETQVQTFDNLADDYICKPFSLILLLKRIEALLRARYKTENTWKYSRAAVFSADFSHRHPQHGQKGFPPHPRSGLKSDPGSQPVPHSPTRLLKV